MEQNDILSLKEEKARQDVSYGILYDELQDAKEVIQSLREEMRKKEEEINTLKDKMSGNSPVKS